MSTLSLEERIQHMEDVHEIQNLMGKYVFYHMAGLHKETAELFAQKTPGVKAEVGPLGIWEGTEGIKRFFVDYHEYQQADRIGSMNIHTLTSPVIEVAKDGKTAKGIWISPGAEVIRPGGKKKAIWMWGKYGVDFVKEDGVWKFWHFHIYGCFMCSYEEGWLDGSNLGEPNVPAKLKADRPSNYHWQYTPTAVFENVPVPPQPYETFDESTAFVK